MIAADKFGRFTVFMISSLVIAILILALWLPGYGTGAIVTFSVLFGFVSGTVVGLAPTLVSFISDVRQIGVRTGTMFACVAVAVLVGSPIGGQLILADNGSYKTMQIFSGCLCMGGAVCYTALRFVMSGKDIKKRV